MKSRGLSLIELSVVIVVISLAVGAILAGQEMINNAKTKTLVKEIGGISSAINAFYLKYNAVPGDMSNATSYWATASNGDGDGRVCCYMDESIYIWNHLSRSEIMTGDFDGTYANLYDSVPESKSGLGFFKVHYASMTDDNWNLSSSEIYEQTGNFLGFGNKSTIGDYALGTITGRDAESMDKKMDDGNASSGSLVAISGTDNLSTYQGGCVTSTSFGSAIAGSVSYNLTDETNSCRLIYFLKEL